MDKENRYLELRMLDCSPAWRSSMADLSYLSWSTLGTF